MRNTARLILLFVIIIAGGAYSAFCQDCDHVSNAEERFENIRVKPLAKITFYDGVSVEFVTSDKFGVHLNRFDLAKETRLPKNFNKSYKKGLYWVVYCAKDKFIYSISLALPEQYKKQ